MAVSPFDNLDVEVIDLKNQRQRSQRNVTDMTLTIPFKGTKYVKSHSVSLMPLAHLHCDEAQPRISCRIPYLAAFAKWANDVANNDSKSIVSISNEYQVLKQYIYFCDAKGAAPFSESSYFAYQGNDGELWRQVRLYKPSRYLFEYEDGQELGLKEASARSASQRLNLALHHCKFDVIDLKNQCRCFKRGNSLSDVSPYKPYEQDTAIQRLSNVFFVLAAELIAHKKGDIEELPEFIEVPIEINGGVDIVKYETAFISSRKVSRWITGTASTNHSSAFNQCMAAAYHLLCYYTSLNDTVIRELCHPIEVETDSRDKSLKMVTVSGFKRRANKQVDATLSNEVEGLNFDVDKRDGVTFMETLKELSLLYSIDNDGRLLYELDKNEQVTNSFRVSDINKILVPSLHLLSSKRSGVADWLIENFRVLTSDKMVISLGTTTDEKGRVVVARKCEPASTMSVSARAPFYAFGALSCLTDVALKNILIPLTYHDKDDQGNVAVTFNYLNGTSGLFKIPAKYKPFLEDLEAWAQTRNGIGKKVKRPAYLIPMGGKSMTRQWDGLSPLTFTNMTSIGLRSGELFIDLNSSRFRKTTSDEEYSDTNMGHVINLLQNTLATIDVHYANGDPELNKLIISQAIKVLQRIAKGDSLEDAKQSVCKELEIKMLAHDKWLETKEASNPNGLSCNGEQDLVRGKKTQRSTNKALGAELPCSEFDMCYLCKSAKGIDEPNSVYKLISFIDVLKEALDRYPDAKAEVKEKIAAFENILLGASDAILNEAQTRFEDNGRHPRISMSYALASTKGAH